MTEQQNVYDMTRIPFQRDISYEEVGDLMRYLAFNLEGRAQVHLSSSQSERFGNLYNEKSITQEDLEYNRFNERFSGAIEKTVVRSAQFSLESEFNEDDEKVYCALVFNVTPEYEPGELHSDDASIMKETRQVISNYFTSRPQQKKN